MSEKHPIDELFHHALHDAQVAPPPEVWEGIVRTRRSRRWGWWPWAVAAILVVGAGGAWWMMDEQTATTGAVVGTGKPATPVPSAVSRPQDTGAAEQPAGDPVGTNAVNTPGQAVEVTGGNSTASSSTAPPAGLASTPYTTTAPGRSVASLSVRSDLGDVPAPFMPATALPKDPESKLTRLDLLPPELAHTEATGKEPRRTEPPTYMLPKVERWLALEFGTYDVDRTWYGDDADLVSALNATDVPHPTWSAGALFGWSWRSGFGMSVGAAYEASRYDYQHVDRALGVDSIVQTPYFVTLDTMVFVSSTVTTVYGTNEDKVVNGSNSLGLLHVPVEAYWHTSMRRWSLGARAGLIGEFTVSRRGYTLVNTGDDGIRSVPNDDPAFNSRYAPVISGTIGADLGYLLTERWGLWASPTYMHGITALGTTDQPWALPQRFSLRVRLSYSLSRTH